MWIQQIQSRATRLSGRCSPNYRFLGGGGSKTKTVDPFAEIRPLQTQLNDLLSGQIGQGVERFGGERVPGASGLQSAGFDVAQGLTPIASGGQQFGAQQTAGLDPGTAGRVTGQAEQALSGILGPQDL